MILNNHLARKPNDFLTTTSSPIQILQKAPQVDKDHDQNCPSAGDQWRGAIKSELSQDGVKALVQANDLPQEGAEQQEDWPRCFNQGCRIRMLVIGWRGWEGSKADRKF